MKPSQPTWCVAFECRYAAKPLCAPCVRPLAPFKQRAILVNPRGRTALGIFCGVLPWDPWNHCEFNTNGDAYTGSNQANRIIIEEVEPPVA